MSIRIFLDVDGVINLPMGLMDDVRGEVHEVTRLTLPNESGRRFPIEETISIQHDTLEFFRELPSHVEIWWLTGWRSSASETFDELLGIRSAGWLDWTHAPGVNAMNELGKALDAFLKDSGTERFIWVDDVATQHELGTNIPHLRLLTDYTVGFSGRRLRQARDFLGM